MNTTTRVLTHTNVVGAIIIACAVAFGFVKVQANDKFNDLEIAHIA